MDTDNAKYSKLLNEESYQSFDYASDTDFLGLCETTSQRQLVGQGGF